MCREGGKRREGRMLSSSQVSLAPGILACFIFALIWFYTILSDIISLFGRERAQSQLCPRQILRKPVFSFKRKSFIVLDFFFGVNGWCLSKIGFEYYIKIVFCNSLISHSCMWLNSVISKACENRHFYAIAVAQQECRWTRRETKSKNIFMGCWGYRLLFCSVVGKMLSHFGYG